MESNHYTKTTGGGVSVSPSTAPLPLTLSPCQHINGKGHRCRMFTNDPNSTLCAHHVRKQIKTQRLQNEAAGKELLAGIEDFSTADAINVFLGNLVKQLALKRVERRDAIALAYLSQLLLNSLTALDRQFEAERDEEGTAILNEFLRRRQPAATSGSSASNNDGSRKHGTP